MPCKKQPARRLEALLSDGGASRNDWLMQFQADLLDRPVFRSRTAELSGLGAAFAAGLGAGFWSSPDDLAAAVAPHDPFQPAMDDEKRKRLVHGWNRAVESVKAWLDKDPQRVERTKEFLNIRRLRSPGFGSITQTAMPDPEGDKFR